MNHTHTVEEHKLEEICSYISGEFVENNSPALVVIKTADFTYHNTVEVNSKVQKELKHKEIVHKLAELISTDETNLHVEVYVMCGGIDGSQVELLHT